MFECRPNPQLPLVHCQTSHKIPARHQLYTSHLVIIISVIFKFQRNLAPPLGPCQQMGGIGPLVIGCY